MKKTGLLTGHYTWGIEIVQERGGRQERDLELLSSMPKSGKCALLSFVIDGLLDLQELDIEDQGALRWDTRELLRSVCELGWDSQSALTTDS